MKAAGCSECGKPAVYFQAYAARELCAGCFVRHFEKRFLRTVREFKMIKPGDRIALGISGGKDSVVLLHLLAGLRKKLPFELTAIAIDEGISGYRPPTLVVARRECRKLNVPLKILSFKKELGHSLDQIMKKTGSGACSWCGVFRRHLLNKGALLVNADKLAIGHNLDDVAQTVLMNIMRNEPSRLVRFLSPLTEDEGFVPRIRPLMRLPEREVAAYAVMRGIGIKYSECPYAHQSFRQHVKQQLNDTEALYPGTKARILNSFLSMEKWMRKGMEGEKFEFVACEKCGEPSGTSLCMKCKMLNKLGH